MVKTLTSFIDDLLTDHGTGMWSHTKFWANVAYGTSTGVVIWLAYKETLSTEIFVGYLLTVSGHTAVSKWLSHKDNKRRHNGYSEMDDL